MEGIDVGETGSGNEDMVDKLMNQAFALGSPRVTTHPQTGRTLFMKLHYEFKEVMGQSWATLKTQLSKGQIPQIADASSSCGASSHGQLPPGDAAGGAGARRGWR